MADGRVPGATETGAAERVGANEDAAVGDRSGVDTATGALAVRRVETPPDGSLDGVPLYDLRGLQCPLPVLKTARRMRDMAPGGRLWVETTDPLAVIDVPAFARENGHAIAETHEVEGGHRFLLIVGGAS